MTGFSGDPARIAFVDTGNTGRSVTAEALAVAYIKEKGLNVAVISRAVDLNPFSRAPEPNAAILLKQRGLDVGAHRAEQLTINDVRHADVILTMTQKHRETVRAMFREAEAKTFLLAEYATGEAKDVEDALGKPMAVYEAMLAEVSAYAPAAIEKASAGK
jgi:protein-tyrosine phosphatase